MAAAPAGLSAQVTAQFTAALNNAQQRLNSMNPAQLAPAVSVLVQFLRDCETEYRAARELLRELHMRLMLEWAAVSAALHLSEEDPANEPLLNLKTGLEGFGAAAEAGAEDPGAAANELQQKLGDLQADWRQVFERLIQTIPEQRRANILNLVQNRDFVSAAQQTAEAAALQGNAELGEEEGPPQAPGSWPQVSGFLAGLSSDHFFVNAMDPTHT